MKRLKLVFVVALFVFVIAFPITLVEAQPPQDVVVPLLQIPVTLDGVITGAEWSDAVMISVLFYFNDPGSTTRDVAIYLKHDGVNLWICFQIEDPTENTVEWVSVDYDVSGDGAPMTTGDDEKAMFHPNTSWDIAITGPNPITDWANDTDIGGTLDIQGASGWAGGILTYEFVHPLNSGDAAGNDLAIRPGENILTFFMAGDPELGEEYYGYPQTYYNLIIETPVGGEILPVNALLMLAPYLLILVVIVAGAAGILYKKRIP